MNAADKELIKLVDKLKRGCSCEYDHRCANCQAIIDVKAYCTEPKEERNEAQNEEFILTEFIGFITKNYCQQKSGGYKLRKNHTGNLISIHGLKELFLTEFKSKQ